MITRKKRKIKYVVSILIALVIFFFLFNILYKNINKLKQYDWSINFFLLVIALIFLYFGMIFSSLLWGVIIKKVGVNLTFRKTIKIWFISQMGRYVPGKVWLLFGRFYLAKKEGVSQYKTLLSVMLELSLTIVGGILIFFITLPFWYFIIQQKIDYIFIIIALIVTVLIGLIFLYPPVFNIFINFVLKLIKKKKINLEVKYGDILKILFLYFIQWIILGFGFYFIINSVYPIKINLLPAIIGMFTIAWIVSFLSFLTPGGLGVREGVLSYLLSFFMPLPIAIIVSLVSRICLIIVEGSLALLSLKL